MSPHTDALALSSRLAYEAAAAALAGQQRAVSELGAKAIGLLTSNLVATSLFGGWVVSLAGTLSALSWCAIGSAVIASLSATAVVVPTRELELQLLPPAGILGVAERMGAAGLQWTLAEHLVAAYNRNETHLARAAAHLQRSAVLMAVAALSWVANLAVIA